MIQITNFQFNQFNITYNINQDQITGIYCVDNKLLEPIMLQISGINKSQGILYRSRKVFDNPTYFDDRLYLDCNKKIIDTLHAKKISYSLEKRYKLIINENKLDQLVDILKVRMEGTLSGSYTFTKEGKALCNNIIALSSFKYPILLNPLENINDKNRLTILKEQYKEKNCLIGISDLSKYKNFLNCLILLGHKNTYVLTDKDKIVILSNVINQDLVISECKLENLIIHKCIQNENIIIYNDLTPLQKVLLDKFNITRKEVTIYDMGGCIC